VPHHEPQDFVRLVEAAELAGVQHLAAEDLPVVFVGITISGPEIRVAKNPSSCSTFITVPPLQPLRI